MQLTLHTDYALRALVYLAVAPERSASVGEIAEAYAISKDHLLKVVQRLGALGYVETRRGRAGGVSLLVEPEAIHVGEVVRQLESSLALVECLGDDPACAIAGACGLTSVLREARDRFLGILDEHTIADCVRSRPRVAALLQIQPRR